MATPTERLGMPRKKLARLLRKAMNPAARKESISQKILREARKQKKDKK